jgi:TrpR-related protein YerC/YecD
MAGKVRYGQLTELEKKQYLGEFYTMISLLRSREEAKNFFKDLLTLSEVVMISRRLHVARLLMEGWKYEEIRRKMKIGVSTISHVDRWLNSGFGGYKSVVRRFKNGHLRKGKQALPATPFSWRHIKRKYPLHFLLLNLLEEKEK